MHASQMVLTAGRQRQRLVKCLQYQWTECVREDQISPIWTQHITTLQWHHA